MLQLEKSMCSSEDPALVSRQDIVPTTTTKWIRLHECRFHGCVDEDVFRGSRVILFNPLDACRFELMRFRTVFAEKTLPFTLRTAASIHGAEVEVQSWLRMSAGFSSNWDPLTQVPCENVMVRYPVPSEWVKNFRRESVLGEKSLKAKVNRGASFGSASISGSEPVMRVTLGTAKYEHAFNAIVWRINRLPDKNSGRQSSIFFESCHTGRKSWDPSARFLFPCRVLVLCYVRGMVVGRVRGMDGQEAQVI